MDSGNVVTSRGKIINFDELALKSKGQIKNKFSTKKARIIPTHAANPKTENIAKVAEQTKTEEKKKSKKKPIKEEDEVLGSFEEL